jgi:hypothetical protein
MLGVRRGLSTKEIGMVRNLDNGNGVETKQDLATFSREALEFRRAVLLILKGLISRHGKSSLVTMLSLFRGRQPCDPATNQGH